MKGVKPKRATLNHSIDIFKMLQASVTEGILPSDQVPSEKELQAYYFHSMLKEIVNPLHMYYIAQRGRGFVGYLHAQAVPSRWNPGKIDAVFLDMIYVVKNKRKNGIGKQMLDLFIKEAKDLRVEQIILLGKDDMVKYWQKQGAEKLSNYMRIKI